MDDITRRDITEDEDGMTTMDGQKNQMRLGREGRVVAMLVRKFLCKYIHILI